MNIFYDFKHIVRQADESILQYVQNGAALGTVNWPSSLTKVPNLFTFCVPITSNMIITYIINYELSIQRVQPVIHVRT